MQLPMNPAAQTPRWIATRDLVHGSRLHLGAHDSLAQELCGLSATQQSSGSLKVEGRKDNQADALALVVPLALRLPPTGGTSAGSVMMKIDGFHFDHESGQLSARNRRWVRVGPDGRETRVEWPRWDPGFEAYANELLREGISTPAIEAWRAERASK
jgi:hypothetical protein